MTYAVLNRTDIARKKIEDDYDILIRDEDNIEYENKVKKEHICLKTYLEALQKEKSLVTT